MDFFNQAGKMAIGSRLRLLTDTVTEDAKAIYKLYGIELRPKWFPVFYSLSQGDNSITEIARHIGHSHPSVSKIITEMKAKGLVAEARGKTDGRKNTVALTRKGKETAVRIREQYADVEAAVEDLLAASRHNLWKAVEEWEFLLRQKPLLRRVQEQKKERESKGVTIVPYVSRYKAVFKALNEEWIATYFKMEASDYKALDNPTGYILNKGGFIFVALLNGKPVGVCALMKMNDPQYDYELAKMAVSPAAQGKNIGWLLGQTVVEKARSLGAKTLFLESNTLLKPAINLYQKLGFQKVAGHPSPYERSNIQMELKL